MGIPQPHPENNSKTPLQKNGYNPAISIQDAEALPALPFSPALHTTITTSFKRANSATFPPTWTRLNPDPNIGMHLLALELGPQGRMAIAFENDEPIACGGFLPYRGGSFINAANREAAARGVEGAAGSSTTPVPPPEPSSQPSMSGEIEDWEICCFCVSPTHQRRGLSHLVLSAIEAEIKRQGAKRFYSHYSIEANEDYWPRMGFETVPGAESVLRKGFTHTAGMEGLRGDLHFRLGVKRLQ